MPKQEDFTEQIETTIVTHTVKTMNRSFNIFYDKRINLKRKKSLIKAVEIVFFQLIVHFFYFKKITYSVGLLNFFVGMVCGNMEGLL